MKAIKQPWYVLLLCFVLGIISTVPELHAQSGATRKYPIDHAKNPSDTVALQNNAIIPQSGMVQDFKALFRTLHGTQKTVSFSGSKNTESILYDSINNLYYKKVLNSNVLRSGEQVFGWHPYWMKEEYKLYPYGLLSTLVFFAYDINPATGSYEDAEAMAEWRSTAMIDSAQKYQIKVLLSVTSYGADANEKFLQDKEAQKTLGDSLRVLINARKAHGVDLDFADIPNERAQAFVEFVRSLRSKLGDTATMTLHLSSQFLNNKAYDLKQLDALINTFIIQPYDYETELKRSGPIAPLYAKADKSCVLNLVEYCESKGIGKKQLILSLPLYGTLWQKGAADNMAYEDIVALYEKNNPAVQDPRSESAYIIISPGDTLWYESAKSLNLKFLWAEEHDLLGVGLWGLGYDGGRPEVWNAVASNFGIAPVQQIFPIAEDKGPVYSAMELLLKHRKTIGLSLLMVFGFFGLGVLLSLLDWRVREVFFRNYSNRAAIAALLLVLGVSVVYCLSSEEVQFDTVLLPFFIGAASGAGVLYFVTRYYISYREKMP